MANSKEPKKPERDQTREERIEMGIVVDARNEEERAMSRYSYLEDELNFPFLTRRIKGRPVSPLRVGDEVEVVGMAPEDEHEKAMFVGTPWEQEGTLAVPLSQLEVTRGDEETRQAVEDWHYRVEMGYEF
jgi:hypothetical protein